MSSARTGWNERPLALLSPLVRPWDDFDAVSIDIYLGGPTRSDLLVTPSFPIGPIGEIARGDAGTVVVVARPERVVAPLRTVRAREIAEAVAGIRAGGLPGDETTRFVLFGVHDDGYLTEVEVALDGDGPLSGGG